jgi:signal transduction histidine kinase
MRISTWRERAAGMWGRHWFAASPRRTLIEALPVQWLLLAWMLWSATVRDFGKITGGGATAIVIAGPCVLLYSVFRLRAPRARLWLRIGIYLALGMVLAVAPAVMTWQLLVAALTDRRGNASEITFGLAIAWFSAYTGAFLFSRGCTWLLRRWNRLRRRHLVWSLTHAHLLVVVIAAATISTVILWQSIARGQVANSVLPILFFLFLLTCVVLVIVLPPSALFSYLFARTMTRRLERLAAATSALRAGSYAMRVPVKGEDEVAQLQANFNAMAEALERALREVQAERDTVTELLRTRRELVASVSHELRTPLATLRGYLDSATAHWDDRPPPTLRQDLADMERETLHLQRLVRDLFTLSRAEVGRLEMRMAPTDVGALAQRLVETQAPLAWQRGRGSLVAEIAPEVPPALADEARLEQVVSNLVQNGVRHTPPGGIVAVGVSAEDGNIVVEVGDTGEGIPAAELPRVWERFYRTAASRERTESGSGLGLALVKELTEAMGGSVAVESTPGRGSRFLVRLPGAAQQSAYSCPAQQDRLRGVDSVSRVAT